VNEPLNPRSPAFQWYPSDFMSDIHVQLMDWTQRGIYVWLIGVCWLEKTIPADIGSLAKLTHVSVSWWEDNGSAILVCFKPTKDGRLTHPRLDKEREKQRAYREIKQKSGEIGAKKRWSKTNKPNKINSNATILPMANDSSSVFSLLSSSSTAVKDIYKTKPQKRAPKEFIIDSDMLNWALKSFPNIDVKAQTEFFMDYEFRVPKTDWKATWRNFIRNSVKFNGNGSGIKPAKKDILDDLLEQAEKEEHAERSGGKVC
jgi:uncharacterized protein YdaU (DUF1376 family)